MKRKISLVFGGVAMATLALSTACHAQTVDEAFLMKTRDLMIEYHLKGRGISDSRVLEAMATTPRHKFVPENLQVFSYADQPLPIGLGQTISQPYIVAIMTELLKPEPEHVVFEVGTGSGYQAAVLSPLVKEVYTVEIVPELGEMSAKRLRELGYDNVHVRIGDGYAGWPERAPFDRIIVTCGAEEIPPPLIEQLKPSGIMVIPVGPFNQVQELMVIEKAEDGEITTRAVMPVRFVPLTGER